MSTPYTSAVRDAGSCKHANRAVDVSMKPKGVVAVVGQKGGSGKTTVARAAARGLGLLGVPAYIIITDNRQDDLHDDAVWRKYRTLDGRTPEKIDALLRKVAIIRGTEEQRAVFIFDGAGTRGSESDLRLADASDAVIVPFSASHNDLSTIFKDYLTLPEWQQRGGKINLLPTRWPTSVGSLDRAKRLFDLYWQKADDVCISARFMAAPVPADDRLNEFVNSPDAEMATIKAVIEAGGQEAVKLTRDIQRINGICRYIGQVFLHALGYMTLPDYVRNASLGES